MNRLPLTFAGPGGPLAGTLDAAAGETGLLIVSGGNEIRAGAFAGQAALAARLSDAGHPVFRFDRSGVGDSPGANAGFRGSAGDIAAALATFRSAVPQMTRVVGFGNCDAASALMLAGGAGCDALVLANPWTFEEDEGASGSARPLPPAAIRARYAAKLANPREIARLLGGGVSLGKLARGIAGALRPAPPPSTLAQAMRSGLDEFAGPVRLLLAGRDRTAQAFAESWDTDDARIARCPGASHAFVEVDAREWLEARLLEAMGGGAGGAR